jgi:hypothetical protein
VTENLLVFSFSELCFLYILEFALIVLRVVLRVVVVVVVVVVLGVVVVVGVIQ